MMEAYLSVSEYADLHQKDPGNVRRMLASGRLTGQKVGNQWIIPADAAYPEDKRITSGNYRNWRRRMELNHDQNLTRTLNNMVRELRQVYGNRLSEVVLYGSYSRGTQTEESDVDVALLLSAKPTREETDAMIRCVAAYELDYGKVLSVIDIDEATFNQWKDTVPFYRNIRKEGITLWKSAA